MVRLQQSQRRKLGFFLESLVNCDHPWAGTRSPFCWWGIGTKANSCEGIFSAFAISARSPLQIEGFILVLIHFQRKWNINKIVTYFHFRHLWQHHYCHCIWKPHLCQRTSAQWDSVTWHFTGGAEQLENRWQKGNRFSGAAPPFTILTAAINAVFL